MANRSARRRAFDAVPETCPDVDAALAEAARIIKRDGTERLRDALIEAYDVVETLEDQVSELESKLDEAQGRIADLEAESAATHY